MSLLVPNAEQPQLLHIDAGMCIRIEMLYSAGQGGDFLLNIHLCAGKTILRITVLDCNLQTAEVPYNAGEFLRVTFLVAYQKKNNELLL